MNAAEQAVPASCRQKPQKSGGQRTSSQYALLRLHLVRAAPKHIDHAKLAKAMQNHPTQRQREIRRQSFLPQTRERNHLKTLFLISEMLTEEHQVHEPPQSPADAGTALAWTTCLHLLKIQAAHEDVPTQQQEADESHRTTSQDREATQSDDGLPTALVT